MSTVILPDVCQTSYTSHSNNCPQSEMMSNVMINAIHPGGAVTMFSFSSNILGNAIARKVSEELQSVTKAVLQCFLLRNTLHEVEFISTFRHVLQQLTTPLQSVIPLQQFFLYTLQKRMHIFFYIWPQATFPKFFRRCKTSCCESYAM